MLATLWKVYEHLLSTGCAPLAAELYTHRATIDYAFLPPKEADPQATTNVYQAQHSGKKWRTDYPPPGLCYTCNMRHWSSECPDRAKDAAPSLSFPRGQPPGRYYVSKGGKVYDTKRRPPHECNQCGKGHWFFDCPRKGGTVHVPKGASFVDSTDRPIENATTARFREHPRATRHSRQ